MVARIFIITSVACVFNIANGLSDPFPGFKPCKTDDADCVLQNAKNGIESFVNGLPDYGVESMDPEFFKRVDASSSNLKFILTDVTSTGLKTCKAIKATRDSATSEIVLVNKCALNLDGDYELNGKILIIDIQGKGKIHVKLPEVINTVKGNYVIKEGKDGKKHLRIKNFVHDFELTQKSTVIFEGLFPDNEVLRQATLEVVKHNGNEIVEEIGKPVFTAAVTRIVQKLNKFFGKIPYDEISLD